MFFIPTKHSSAATLAGALMFACAAYAQSAADIKATTTPVPPVTSPSPAPYPSAFKSYKPYTDESVGNWKAANDTVSRIGGWRAYAKEAQGLDAQAAPDTPQTPQRPASPGVSAPPAAGAAR